MRNHPSFLFLARWVTPEQARRIEKLKLEGVGVLSEPRRVYPHKELAAAVVGFANIDAEGVRGIEQREDAWLRGVSRRLPAERDARGNLMLFADEDSRTTAGGDLALTIDATLQALAEEALREAMADTGATGGVVVSMDPRTGDILALAEAPSFDPNRFRKLDYGSTRSRAFLDAVEPGSTLKLFLIASALDTATIGADQSFDCENGSFQIPGKTLRDAKPYGALNPTDILRVSSNIGAVKIGFALGPQAHYTMLRRFGFGERTDSHFPDESAGLMRSWTEWTSVDHATIAFGQGIGVTAIQLAAATATLANDGEWVRPTLVARRRAADLPWRADTREPARRVVQPETAARVVAMLERAVSSDGTGRLAALEGVRVAGKTGTAQKLNPETGRYANNRFRAWFAGIVPADDPSLVILAGLDEPKRPTHTGGAAAAPLFARVASAQLARFGIHTRPRNANVRPAPVQTVRRTRPPKAAKATTPAVSSPPPVAKKAAPPRPARVAAVRAPLARVEDRILVPDFRGWTVEEVKRITATGALEVEVSGQGRAVFQDPPPGTVVPAHGGTVRVRFADAQKRES
jgi:cell division protein FtsI (penicillin-binding protein 3)